MKIHGLGSNHKRSRNNPGEPADIPDRMLAYRTTLCGQVKYAKRDDSGSWVWQDGRLMAVDAESDRVTCQTCINIRSNHS